LYIPEIDLEITEEEIDLLAEQIKTACTKPVLSYKRQKHVR